MALERALSKPGLASRSRARRFIEERRVRVGGGASSIRWRHSCPTVRIAVDGQPAVRRAWTTIAFHRPRGGVSASRDPEGRTTIYDVLGEQASGLVAVGRLDLASTGLLPLTNDSSLAWLTDPGNVVPRTYVVTVRGEVSDQTAASIERGIHVDGESSSRRRSRCASDPGARMATAESLSTQSFSTVLRYYQWCR